MHPSQKIPILFTQVNSNYLSYPFADCYDEKRDALTFSGHQAVIAHPPCRLWSRLRQFSTAPIQEKELAIWAINLVRKNGGILEHPAGSSLFSFMNIPRDGSYDEFGGFILSIHQHWFGYPARKKTYLYICGCTRSQLPSFPLSFNAIEYSVSNSKVLKEIPKRERSTTPSALCEFLFLIQIAIERNKSSKIYHYEKVLCNYRNTLN